jgi:DNA-binding transcriptional LysR family regulator
MLDAVTLDQLRTFIAAADEGSFSAAALKLRRAQSVVSQTLANLEGQFGVKLFDRARRRPVLTAQGQALLAHARTVAGDVDRLKALAKHLAGGLEPELSIAVDVMFPIATLTAAVKAFHVAFPLTPMRLYVETLGAVMQAVLDERCTLGLSGQLASAPPRFTEESLLMVPLIHVTSPQHPLATYGKRAVETHPTRAHRPLHPVQGTRPRRPVHQDVATCGSWRQTRLSTSGTGLGRDAGRTGSTRSLTGHPGEDCCRRCTRGVCRRHERGVSHGGATRNCGTVVHRSAQARIGAHGPQAHSISATKARLEHLASPGFAQRSNQRSMSSVCSRRSLSSRRDS